MVSFLLFVVLACSVASQDACITNIDIHIYFYNIYTHSFIHSYIHSFIHTYIHTFIYIFYIYTLISYNLTTHIYPLQVQQDRVPKPAIFRAALKPKLCHLDPAQWPGLFRQLWNGTFEWETPPFLLGKSTIVGISDRLMVILWLIYGKFHITLW